MRPPRAIVRASLLPLRNRMVSLPSPLPGSRGPTRFTSAVADVPPAALSDTLYLATGKPVEFVPSASADTRAAPPCPCRAIGRMARRARRLQSGHACGACASLAGRRRGANVARTTARAGANNAAFQILSACLRAHRRGRPMGRRVPILPCIPAVPYYTSHPLSFWEEPRVTSGVHGRSHACGLQPSFKC